MDDPGDIIGDPELSYTDGISKRKDRIRCAGIAIILPANTAWVNKNCIFQLLFPKEMRISGDDEITFCMALVEQ